MAAEEGREEREAVVRVAAMVEVHLARVEVW